ncbi:hypothetical protein B0A52_07942 [Exophiala mesophila]|uniref:CFEM domain-containing protein n=1 Tax=Exophiala mesophila TaxID=212818 RepID=A0A438MXU1_EXOME|nr:hypothetical protein B0A52_07942 [Exophiala mesophila]
MRAFTATTLGLLSLLHLSAAQEPTLPACATSCALTAIGSTGCSVTDAACICSATSFLEGVQACITTACSAEDQQATLAYAQSFCLSGGVTITLPTGAAPAPTSSEAAVTSASAPASAPATTSATESVEPSTTSAPPSAFTGGANAMKQQWAVMGMLGLGVAAVL